jgi:hypothetical protein
MNVQAVMMPVPISRRLRARAQWVVGFAQDAHPDDRFEMAVHATRLEELADAVEALEVRLRPRTSREQRRWLRRALAAIGRAFH